MKKAMSKIAQINKEELSKEVPTEKVDLALLPDLIAKGEKVEQLFKEANKAINIEGNKFLDRIIGKVKELNNVSKDLRVDAKDFVQKAEALGLDRATIDREMQKINQAIKSADKQGSNIAQRIAEIRNAIF
jgi:hypothetical protein